MDKIKSKFKKKKHNSAHAQGFTRNEGIKISKGEYVAFLDDDDWWFPGKLEIQMKLMLKMGVDFCFTNGRYCYSGDDNGSIFHAPAVANTSVIDLYKIASGGNLVICSAVLVKKSVVESVGMFRIILYEDYDLWQRILKKDDRCLYIADPYMCYDVQHGGGQYYNSVNKKRYEYYDDYQ